MKKNHEKHIAVLCTLMPRLLNDFYKYYGALHLIALLLNKKELPFPNINHNKPEYN